MTTARPRRFDPDRRDRIVGACLDVIGEVGVAGISHRRVAAAADVPLGSMTYHFAGMHELLHEAFDRFTHTASERFQAAMAAAGDVEQAREQVVQLITVALTDRRELVLMHELYTLAIRDPAYRDITEAWMARSRAALERHFDPLSARILDALIEGLTIHRALDLAPGDPEVVRTAVARATAAADS